MSLPNFMCIGAAKSGTTTLYDILSQHPDIFTPSFKEPHFFDIPINYTINRPLLFFGILSLIVGFQLISIGLIGELIVRYYKKENSNIKNYNVIE